MIKKDSHGRGWEITYAVYIRDFDEDEQMAIPEDEAIEIANSVLRNAFNKDDDIVDWDGPL